MTTGERERKRSARVVTISAGYGAGGAAVGPMLAERLGLPFADRLIEPRGRPSVAAGEGVTDAELDEEPRSALVRSLALLSPTWNLPTAPEEPEDVPERMRELVEDSIRTLCGSGGAVILGRGAAACIGRKRPWAFHVRLHGPAERRGIVHVGRPMEGGQRVLPRAQAELAQYGQSLRRRQHPGQAVHHDVAHKVDLLRSDAFAPQIVVGVARGREQQVGDLVGEQAVDFLRHGAVAGAQSGFDVGHRNA